MLMHKTCKQMMFKSELCYYYILTATQTAGVKTPSSNAGGTGLTPGQGTKVSYAPRYSQKNFLNPYDLSKFSRLDNRNKK